MGYLANFMVYTLAMVGIIVVALLVFKNATMTGSCKSSKYLKIIDSMSIGQRKNLLIVSTGKEQFLIASDVDKTSLISKLNDLSEEEKGLSYSKCELNQNDFSEGTQKSFKDTMKTLSRPSYMDKSNIGIHSSILKQKSSENVIRNLAEIMRK